jgi:molybdate transport system substrate-binding protein
MSIASLSLSIINGKVRVKISVASALALIGLFAFAATGSGAEVKIMSPIALKPVLTNVAASFEKSGSDKVELIWGESGRINADIEAGASFDIAILTSNFVDALVKQGKLDGTTRVPVARSGIGVAVKKGAPKPDVSTTDAFKRAMIEAKSIGFVDQSASSRYLAGLFVRLGIADQIKDKLKPLHGTAAQYVAMGDPEIALTQIATIIPFPEVDYAGPLPPDIQLYTIFTAAASPSSDAEKMRTLLKAIVAPENGPTLRAIGLEPLVKD